uniref:Uncharacterized protein n=1 Tax=Tanacetum cinerariifolium TaxID=118510 RepID=A0A699KES1_TANCI|nr:hypothetical protein [Tanacetum cinerariifolium]
MRSPAVLTTKVLLWKTCDDDSFEDIDYVEASHPNSELVSLEEVKDDICKWILKKKKKQSQKRKNRTRNGKDRKRQSHSKPKVKSQSPRSTKVNPGKVKVNLGKVKVKPDKAEAEKSKENTI